MTQAVLRIDALPDSPLDAAAEFHQAWLPRARAAARRDDLVLVLPIAGYEHRGWRLAAIQDLACEAAPRRVNAVAGTDQGAIDETIEWLAKTPGITGQILAVDGKPVEID